MSQLGREAGEGNMNSILRTREQVSMKTGNEGFEGMNYEQNRQPYNPTPSDRDRDDFSMNRAGQSGPEA